MRLGLIPSLRYNNKEGRRVRGDSFANASLAREAIVKKILALSAVLMLCWSCALQNAVQAPSGQGGSREAPSPQGTINQAPPQQVPIGQAPSNPDPTLFAGRSVEGVFVATKIALGDCRYAIKSSDQASGLIVATGSADAAAGGRTSPTATVIVFTDSAGTPGVKIQVIRPGQPDESSIENRAESEKILAAIRDLLRCP